MSQTDGLKRMGKSAFWRCRTDRDARLAYRGPRPIKAMTPPSVLRYGPAGRAVCVKFQLFCS